jgi:hypothetical protein
VQSCAITTYFFGSTCLIRYSCYPSKQQRHFQDHGVDQQSGECLNADLVAHCKSVSQNEVLQAEPYCQA